jgi:hypothetical protein
MAGTRNRGGKHVDEHGPISVTIESRVGTSFVISLPLAA